MVIDLEEVSLVDREVVVFFAGSETRAIEIRNCPTYIREWIGQRDGINKPVGEKLRESRK